MCRGLSALILLRTMSVIQTLKVPDKIPLIEAELGQTVNLTCDTSGHDNGLFFWYKMNYGHMAQTVVSGTFSELKLDKNFPNPRFQIENVGNIKSLIIRNVSKEDEATYLCQTGAAYNLAFVYGTNLIVNDSDSQNKKSYRVNQTSDMKSILLGTSVTLQCSLHPEKKKKGSTDQCADEHDVFWFRAESESNPGFIYADKKHCSKQAGRSCEYRLPKTIQNSSDAGTYYCAVVTCGEILFGEGTKVETREELFLYAIVLLGGLLACSVLVNITLILQRRKPKQLCENHKENPNPQSSRLLYWSQRTALVTVHVNNTQDGEEDGMNYVALNFSSRKPTRWKSKRETSDTSTYSNIKLSMKGSIHQR
uniref:Ig-like domain-containing protein n=1 Tax=Poecilia formosa TaxID=48698 RepID=A0A087X6I4_POEFO